MIIKNFDTVFCKKNTNYFTHHILFNAGSLYIRYKNSKKCGDYLFL